jgi:hypothetical protein
MHITCLFFLVIEQQAENKFCFEVRKTVLVRIKDVKLFVEMKVLYACLQVVENFQSDMRTSKVIQEVGGHQLLKIQEQLPEFMNS